MENETAVISKTELQNAISESVKSVVRELNLDKTSQVISPDNTNVTNPSFLLHSLLCAVKKRDRSMIREVYEKAASPMTEGTSADGGYLVPAVTQSRILELIPTFSQARQYMEIIPMGKTTSLSIPKENALPSVNWVNENAAISDAKPTLGIITLTAKKAAGIVVLSNELLEDANVDIGNYIMKKFAQKFGTAEDTQFFSGSGSPFSGVFRSTNTFGNTVTMTGAIGTLKYADLIDCVYGIDSNYLAGASWFMHRTVFSQVRKIVDTQNRPVFVEASGATPASLLGYPVVLVENAPSSASASGSPVILLGNLKNSFIGSKSEISVKILEEASIGGTSLAEQDLTAIRVIERVGFDPGLTAAYSVVKLG